MTLRTCSICGWDGGLSETHATIVILSAIAATFLICWIIER